MAQDVFKGAPQKYHLGERVTKVSGSSWTGLVVGFYSTALTPIGYAVESETEKGSVQIYPEEALIAAPLVHQQPAQSPASSTSAPVASPPPAAASRFAAAAGAASPPKQAPAPAPQQPAVAPKASGGPFQNAIKGANPGSASPVVTPSVLPPTPAPAPAAPATSPYARFKK